jgi:Ser-tRNA(Ala) deacylase AlaX
MSNKGNISKMQPLVEKRVRMHSAEHILTAVMRRLFASGSVPSPGNLEMHLGEVHLGEKKSKCDYTVLSTLTPQDIEKIERTVNAEIEKDHQITTEVLPIEEAERIYDLWKVPPDAATIRIVKIGSLDATPCSGEHVFHTNQIGHFRIKSYTMREENVVRIRFGLEDAFLIRSAQDGCLLQSKTGGPREFSTKN